MIITDDESIPVMKGNNAEGTVVPIYRIMKYVITSRADDVRASPSPKNKRGFFARSSSNLSAISSFSMPKNINH